ncbi:hypothetical protein AB1Y20_022318 [Prymnesium parvum]|uniref:Uncharacterized protein n=1 Tax=Prymnesium parvum TaxID=97485 RepID=A0AB34JHK7_PRYPA
MDKPAERSPELLATFRRLSGRHPTPRDQQGGQYRHARRRRSLTRRRVAPALQPIAERRGSLISTVFEQRQHDEEAHVRLAREASRGNLLGQEFGGRFPLRAAGEVSAQYQRVRTHEKADEADERRPAAACAWRRGRWLRPRPAVYPAVWPLLSLP